jgi:murein DD-endopeptidase MepM/ murein hydrolase activator NlpD
VRRLAPIVVVVLAIVGTSASAAEPEPPEAVANAIVARVSQPGQADEIAGFTEAPPTATGELPAWVFPADGSAVILGAATTSVSAQPGVSSSAQATASVISVSLFGGEIVADAVSVRSSAAAGTANASADASGSSVTSLAVLGQPVTAVPNGQVALGDWGMLDVLPTSVDSSQVVPRSARSSVRALRVRLSAEHGGLPAGSVIEIGLATAEAAAAGPALVVKPTPGPKPVPAPKPVPVPVRGPVAPAPGATKEPGKSVPGAPTELIRPSPEVEARLTTGGYVFPAYGPASFGDTFGAPRADVEGGWHHGEDIVGPLGTPLLAVADGTIFSVGWNDIGGWRLWLRDDEGNEFYYAHLSAYSELAVDGTRVEAGDVIGFMGWSGDAEGGVYHLHFEIHPVSLLSLGYGGVVAPYPFLIAWRVAEDVSFDAGRIYVPTGGHGGLRVPRAGAMLLEVDDISLSSGLVPGALGEALTGQAQSTRPAGSDR